MSLFTNFAKHKNVRKLLLSFKYWRLNRTLPAYGGRDEACNKDNGDTPFPLPELQGNVPTGHGDRLVVYASCDNGYYGKFGRAFIGSIVAHGGGCPIHMHVINPSQATLDELAALQVRLTDNPFSYTHELAEITHLRGEEPGIYFYTIRFWRMCQFMTRAQSPCFCLDVDALLQRDATPMLQALLAQDVAFYSRFDKFGGNTKLLAGTLFVNNSEAGMHYIREVGEQIARFFSAGILMEKFDQQVLYAKFLHLKQRFPALKFQSLRSPQIDLEFSTEGTVWYPKGNSKRQDIYQSVERNHRARVDDLLTS